MESINRSNSHDRAITPPRDSKFKVAKKPSGLTVARVRDFSSYMKLIAKYDLWDEMEAELKSQGCTTFFISLKPMRAIGLALKEKVSIGDFAADLPALSACNSCNPPSSGDAGASKSGGTLQPGHSEGEDAGSKGKPQ